MTYGHTADKDPDHGGPHHRDPERETTVRPWSGGASFIGSFHEEPDQFVIVLRGDIDAVAVGRLGLHIAGALEVRARFVTLDAAAVDSYDSGLIDLLGQAQNQLGQHRGLLEVRGLHPKLLPPGVAPSPDGAS